MRTTINLDDDVLKAARELSKLTQRTLGQVVSDLARAALAVERREVTVRNGVPILDPRPDQRIVTHEDVAALLNEADVGVGST